MIELRILSGKMAGQSVVARHFPFFVGRAPDCDLCLLEDGVWDKHLEIAQEADKVVLRTVGAGQVQINDEKVSQAVLRVGDEVRLGSVRLELWCSPMEQRSLKWMEYALWIGGGVLMALELLILLGLAAVG
jgi:pSer/pThr/pTyr-binding forkhead associated (FHA) protein